VAVILLVDDKPNILTVMGGVLAREGYEVETARDGREAMAMALRRRPDLVISDVQMDGLGGVELFHALTARSMDVPFIFITAYATVPEAVSTIRAGAVDYLTKPVDYRVLKSTIRRALAGAREQTRSEVSEERFLVGSSPAMQALYERIDAVATAGATVLIHGENGTGKELVARALHRKSRRKDGPFLPVNCAAFNANLLEAELFGYEAGAFTGAQHRKTGFLEAAAGGTVLLDEITEIPTDLQVKLLRVLQERAFTRVGGTTLVRADFRLIAATNRDILELVQKRQFRQDLYYRLDVVPIQVPALRERFEDLPQLVAHFAQRVCATEGMLVPKVSEDFIAALRSHDWPGNVRELENLIERIIVLYRPSILGPRLLQKEVPGLFVRRTGDERGRLVEALRQCCGSKVEAARLLDLPRRTLYNRLVRYSIREDEYK
jgi:two-component system response regulator AtoC